MPNPEAPERTIARRRSVSFCHLCGETFGDRTTNREHVPPDRFFPSEFRGGSESLQLRTLQVHQDCNESYQLDEDYFVTSIGPLAKGTAAGDALLRDLAASFSHEEQRALGLKVLAEFGVVVSPSGFVLKAYEPARVNRVIWKIIRGLFFIEHGRYLPIDTPRMFELATVHDAEAKLPEWWSAVRDSPERAHHPGAFTYKHQFYGKDGIQLHLWGLLFWDAVLVTAAFHDPEPGGQPPA